MFIPLDSKSASKLVANFGGCLFLLGAVSAGAEPRGIDALAEAFSEVEITTHSAAEYSAASSHFQALLKELELLEQEETGGDLPFAERIDRDLLRRHLQIQIFEIDEVELWRQVPVRYLALSRTDSLLLRPCSAGSEAVATAVTELERLPEVLRNGAKNLTIPARVWTENAIYTARYAEILLGEELLDACLPQGQETDALMKARGPALLAVEDYRAFLENDLLPRSTRSPAWKPAEIERYQLDYEMLENYPIAELLRIAAEEEIALTRQMTALAKRIHPSGDLERVWQVMKDEAPPWSEVLPMAQKYVELAAAWLATDGSHIVGIPTKLDYGAVLSTPMARRILSFGGASYGPTVAGRLSGYYVLTPLEPWLTADEAGSRIKSYNPYWTNVISYHEWVGHNVQRAWAELAESRPVRRLYRSAYLSQAWSFYLEKLFEDEGFFDTLPHMEGLKSRMARLQMRMWRVQRILTKLKMSQGSMTFDEAVEAYITKIGMEPTNAYIEVQRDCQTPASPGREIIGERVLLDLRKEYEKRMGEHYDMRQFHEALLSHGELPLPVLGKILLGDR